MSGSSSTISASTTSSSAAVLHDTSPEVTEPTATTVLRPGFRRGDRVLRTAMVGVTDPESPAPAAEPASAEAPADEQPGAGPAVG